MTLKAIEFYSGLGGLHRGLTTSLPNATVAAAFDWDPAACTCYDLNYGSGIVHKKDISTITVEDLEQYEANIWLASPSCQPYTVLNANAKGASDPRARSFIHLIESVLPSMVERSTHPQFLLVENVAGFEASSTRTLVCDILREHGYYIAEFLLTPLQIGIPNARLRYYLMARRVAFEGVGQAQVSDHIPGQDCWRNTDYSCSSISTYLDAIVDEATTIPTRVLERWGRLFDIVLPSSQRSCCFTRGYTHMVEGSGSILQCNETFDTQTIFNEFLTSQSKSESNAVQKIQCLGLRYFSPEELLRLFCLSTPNHSLIWPHSVSRKTKYRLIGNSVNVAVISRLITFLCGVQPD